MTVRGLISMLLDCNPEHEVKIYDGNTEQLETVTGMLYGGTDKMVELCSDGMNL